MLQTLKKFYKFKKLFYGVNSGNYGFLMNKFSNKNFLKKPNYITKITQDPYHFTNDSYNQERPNKKINCNK